MSESDFSHFLSPLRVGPKILRNRLLVTAPVPRIADGDVPGDRYVAYHRAKARGGVAMQITGATPVHRTSALGSRGGSCWSPGAAAGRSMVYARPSRRRVWSFTRLATVWPRAWPASPWPKALSRRVRFDLL